MAARYLIRLDDIAPNMAWDRFHRLAAAFDQHAIKPLLGVIPDNRDPQLLQFPLGDGDFWDEMRSRQASGWEIAQHGYQHCYVTNDCGLMGVNGLSEFAGLLYHEQLYKLARGQSLLREHGLEFETFMAPSHSFDVTTLQALRVLGFTTVTDGFAPFPYVEQGLIFLPQWVAQPRPMPFGIQTFCLHINTMTEAQLDHVEKFLATHAAEFLTFPQARQFATTHRWNRAAGQVVSGTLRTLRRWRRRTASAKAA